MLIRPFLPACVGCVCGASSFVWTCCFRVRMDDMNSVLIYGCVFLSLECFVKMLNAVMQLRIARAPEPSTVLWEHLGAPTSERIGRRIITTALTVVFLCASFALLLWASFEQRKASNSGGGDAPCATGVNATVLNQGMYHVNLCVLYKC